MQGDERNKVVSEGKRNLWIFVRNGKKMNLFLILTVLSMMGRCCVVDVFGSFSVESLEKQMKEKWKKIFKKILSLFLRFK